MTDFDLYSFVYRGVLTDEALDRAGRQRRSYLGPEEARAIQKSLSFDLLDLDRVSSAQRMALVYTAIHAFENSVRALTTKAMAEKHGEDWWDKVPERIRKNCKTRMDEDSKFRWHSSWGASEINYCDFGDLSSIIITNWSVFEDLLGNMEWAKAILNTLEKSRNIVMHGGSLAGEDIERIGMNIRDWIHQTG
jgi:Swt1-like HEPN